MIIGMGLTHSLTSTCCAFGIVMKTLHLVGTIPLLLLAVSIQSAAQVSKHYWTVQLATGHVAKGVSLESFSNDSLYISDGANATALSINDIEEIRAARSGNIVP